MPLSRLENFLRSVRGNIIYVDPNALDATDSIENDGTSAARPFKTLQRALIEASRFSYLPGPDNDKFANTTILLYPGEHLIDNRPGWIPLSGSSFLTRNGSTSSDFYEFDLQTNFDITTDNNALYKFNSVHGGVIVPRGTSIVGYDLRKTKIRPKYVPNPVDVDEDGNPLEVPIERSAIFRLTGACYLWQMSIFDADPNGQCFIDYTNNKFVPNFSHHKLTVFEYADGVNPVSLTFPGDTYDDYSTDRTDLDIYYQKIGIAYGPLAPAGREIPNDYPGNVDIQTKIDEYRIVGSRGAEVGISSIFSGDSANSTTEITVTLQEELEGLDVDTPIRIDGVTESGYNGQFVVSEVVSSTEIKYNVSTPPIVPKPTNVSGTINIVVDTVTSASPYIFNCSLRSVYGLCGLHADGNSVNGFKSMVVAQFTGISLQKDNNAFVKYDPTTSKYIDTKNVSNIYSDSLARYRPSYDSYHIKASNNAFIQCVSIFAIGFSEHFVGESGGDMSITNSNSNFGAKALVSKGFRDDKFIRDDLGYISHIIPPKEITSSEITIEFDPIDVTKTDSVGIGITHDSNDTRLYLYGRTNESNPPPSVIDGYRIGAKVDDVLYFRVANEIGTEFERPVSILMNGLGGTANSYQKEYNVAKNGNLNDISQNVITLTTHHDLINGETVRVISDSGELPDGLSHDTIYYAITSGSGIGTDQIRLASSLNDAQNENSINILTQKTSNLKIVSRVSDKSSGDIGHPIQWDSTENQWYIRATYNLGSAITLLSLTNTGGVTSRTYISRTPDNRNLEDTIYKLRYVIPKDTAIKARPPLDGYIIQDSTSLPSGDAEIEKQYKGQDNGITKIFTTKTINPTELRSTRFISNASWDGTYVTIQTELPHNLSLGGQVEIVNILSSNNETGLPNLGYNGVYTIWSIPSRRSFTYSLANDPGTFLDNTSIRNTSLPYYNYKKLRGTYIAYRTEQIQKYIQGQQDGIYHIIALNSSNSPNVTPFTDLRFSQPVQYLYPQLDRDNIESDPGVTRTYALPDPIGQVVVNNPQKSITKETLDDFLYQNRTGTIVIDITKNEEDYDIYTYPEHGLNPITTIAVNTPGSAYGSNIGDEILYNAQLTGGSGEGASAVIKINSSGEITDVELMDGGSGYKVNDVLSVVGVATTTGPGPTEHTPGTVRVTSIYDHVGETIKLDGIPFEEYDDYNTYFNITEVTSSRIFKSTSITPINQSEPANVVFGFNTYTKLTGKTSNSNSYQYDNISGIATLTFTSAHGFSPGEKVIVSGADDEFYTGEFIVSKVVSIDSIELNVGPSVNPPSTTNNVSVHPLGYTSRDGNNTGREEKRIVEQYGGITSTLSNDLNATNSEVEIASINSTGLRIGDYIKIDDEIMRISETVNINPVKVFRGLLGTRSRPHDSGSIVKKIYPYPIEFRRHSILRASGHTFEYVGFGPGNYSNAFPDRQDRQITEQEELLSQSFKVDGGINVYTGMNNDGDFYIGNKRVSSATGQEDVFDAPIPSVRGEEVILETGSSINFTNTDNLNVTRSLKVEGGKGSNNVSEFNGPVVFNNKITSNSDKGIEGNSLYLQGNAIVSRKYTVGISTPTISGNTGDVEYYSKPVDGGYSGWIYTSNNAWREFGPIQNSDGRYVGIWSGTHYGTFYGDASGLSGLDPVWKTSPTGIHTSVNVGIGTNQADSDYNLKVQGKTFINGILNVGEIIERVTVDTTVLGTVSSVNINLSDNNVYYFTSNATGNWTINFRSSNVQSLDNFMNVGETLTVAIITTQGATAFYNNLVKIDGADVNIFEYGDLEIIEGNASGIDLYTYVIIKKNASGSGDINQRFTVLRSLSQYKQQS